jgi:nitrous oxidase accessory protein NosD
VKVSKSLIIRSLSGNATDTIIHGMSSSAHGVEVAASSVTLDGFTVRNATGGDKAGVYLGSGTRDSCVLNTTLTGNYRGASLFNSTNAQILRSNISQNTDNGVVVESTKNTLIAGTTISGNQKTGIYVYRLNSNLTIADSVLSSNGWMVSTAMSRSAHRITTSPSGTTRSAACRFCRKRVLPFRCVNYR